VNHGRRVTLLTLAVAAVVSAGCSSLGEVGARPTSSSAAPAEGTEPSTTNAEGSAVAQATPTTAAVVGISATTTTVPPFGDSDAPPVTTSTEQRFEGPAAPDWKGEGWESEAAGEGEAIVTKGVGRMVVDPRGTYEWVRAVGATGPYGDLDVEASVTPRSEELGSIYIGLRGNGNWRGSTPYLPSIGLAVEYAFSPGIASELHVYQISETGGVQDRGSVPVGALRNGQKGRVRVSLTGDTVRAKVWRDGEAEPADWAIEQTTEVVSAGSIHLSYRDEPGGTLDWDDLIVKPLR
jgi:hypothetical protein